MNPKKPARMAATLNCIGQEVSEKLDYIPAKVRAERFIRYKYACLDCEGVEDDGPTVKIALPPIQLLPQPIDPTTLTVSTT